MKVQIGRSSGPYTDLEVESDFSTEELEIVKDTLKMVNKVTGGKENWYVCVNDGDYIIPT